MPADRLFRSDCVRRGWFEPCGFGNSASSAALVLVGFCTQEHLLPSAPAGFGKAAVCQSALHKISITLWHNTDMSQRILVADDDREIVRLLRARLEQVAALRATSAERAVHHWVVTNASPPTSAGPGTTIGS